MPTRLRVQKQSKAEDLSAFLRAAQLTIADEPYLSSIPQIRTCWQVLDACPVVEEDERAIVVGVMVEWSQRLASSTAGRGWRLKARSSRSKEFRTRQALTIISELTENEKLTLAAVAALMGISAPHLCRLLVSQTGYGFLENVQRRRLMGAILLMRDRALSLKEIAARSGFAGMSQFDRRFRAAFHMTPSEFRAHVWSDVRSKQTS